MQVEATEAHETLRVQHTHGVFVCELPDKVWMFDVPSQIVQSFSLDEDASSGKQGHWRYGVAFTCCFLTSFDSLPEKQADEALGQLHQSGLDQAAIVGHTSQHEDKTHLFIK